MRKVLAAMKGWESTQHLTEGCAALRRWNFVWACRATENEMAKKKAAKTVLRKSFPEANDFRRVNLSAANYA